MWKSDKGVPHQNAGKRRNRPGKQRPKNKDEKIYNILLLGETGVGKSTFINAFVNYISFKDFNTATKNKFINVVPSQVTFCNKNNESFTVKEGDDKNEYMEVGKSATQGAKSYIFPLGNGKSLRFIDTPGVGDTEGIDQDHKNIEDVMDFLGGFEYLHGICMLLKANNSRLTAMFEFCIKHLLSRLEKSAAGNIVFIFTNSKGTNYGPGETHPLLEKVLDSIRNSDLKIEIPFNKENSFFMENESYRNLVARKHHVNFDEDKVDEFAKSWDESVRQCVRLTNYITGSEINKGLVPHKIQNTLTINDARRMILLMSKPLADITQLIQNNKQVLTKHRENVDMCKENQLKLTTQLYIPCISLVQIPLYDPVTVCSSSKCATIVTVDNKKMREYNQICHAPCQLENVPKEIIGTPELSRCSAIDQSTQLCKKCFCDFKVHMHVYYLTRREVKQIEDKSIKAQLDKTFSEKEKYEIMLNGIQAKINELDNEHQTVTKCLAAFAHFLKVNSIVPFNDAFKAYIQYLIDREQNLGNEGDLELKKHFVDMLAEYEEEKKLLDIALNNSNANKISSTDISNNIKQLFEMPHTGKQLEELYNKQRNGTKRETNLNDEYVHRQYGGPHFLSSETKTVHKRGTCKQNIQRKECPVEIHLRGLSFGKSRCNYNAAKAIDGVLDIIQEEDGFTIVGEQEAVNKAYALLRFMEKTFFVPISCRDMFLENNKKRILDICKQSSLNTIRVIEEEDADYKGCRKPNSIPFILVGRPAALRTAWRLLNDIVNNTKMEVGSNPNKCVIRIPKDLMSLAVGEDSLHLFQVYAIDGISNVQVKTSSIKVEGENSGCIEEARAILEWTRVELYLPKNFVMENIKNGGASLKQVKELSGIKELHISTPHGDTAKCVLMGLRKTVEKANNILGTLCDSTFDLKYLYDDEETECEEDQLTKVESLPKFKVEFPISSHLFGYAVMKKNLEKAQSIEGITNIAIENGSVQIKGICKEAVEEARLLLEIKEEIIVVSEELVDKSSDAAKAKEIIENMSSGVEETVINNSKRVNSGVNTPLSVDISVTTDKEEIMESIVKIPPKKVYLFQNKIALLLSKLKLATGVSSLSLIPTNLLHAEGNWESISRLEKYVEEMQVHIRTFTVPKHLIGLCIGKDGSNIGKAESIRSIYKVESDKTGQFKVFGSSMNSVFEACSVLEVTESVVKVPKEFAGKIIGTQGSNLTKIKKLSGCININTSHKDLPQDFCLFTVIGCKVSVDIAIKCIVDELDELNKNLYVSSAECSSRSANYSSGLVQCSATSVPVAHQCAAVAAGMPLGAPQTRPTLQSTDQVHTRSSSCSRSLSSSRNPRSSEDEKLHPVNIEGKFCNVDKIKDDNSQIQVFIEKFTVPPHLLKHCTNQCNMNRAQKLVQEINVTDNIIEIHGSSEESVSNARFILEMFEDSFLVDKQYVQQILGFQGSNVTKVENRSGCASLSYVFIDKNAMFTMVGRKDNIKYAKELLQIKLHCLKVDIIRQANSIASCKKKKDNCSIS